MSVFSKDHNIKLNVVTRAQHDNVFIDVLVCIMNFDSAETVSSIDRGVKYRQKLCQVSTETVSSIDIGCVKY